MVKRYNPMLTCGDPMYEDAKGQYVSYQDYQAILKEIDERCMCQFGEEGGPIASCTYHAEKEEDSKNYQALIQWMKDTVKELETRQDGWPVFLIEKKLKELGELK